MKPTPEFRFDGCHALSWNHANSSCSITSFTPMKSSVRVYSPTWLSRCRCGLEVTAMPASLAHDDAPLPRREQWQDVTIARVWRPALRQASNRGRFVKCALMIGTWSLRDNASPRSSTKSWWSVPTRSYPFLSPCRASFRPRARIVHWCHDLHPEASIADGVIKDSSILVHLLRWLLRHAYRRCDTIVDWGPACVACFNEIHNVCPNSNLPATLRNASKRSHRGLWCA